MYEELVSALRCCYMGSGKLCVDCPYSKYEDLKLCGHLLPNAADAIEELSAYAELYKDLTDKGLKTARKLIDAYPRWISVEEALPEFEGAVLCMRKSNVCGVRPYQEILYVDEYGFKNFDDIYVADGVVTHWMPLPKPPEEE